MPATAQPSVKTVTKTARAREQPIRDPLTPLFLGFLELRFLLLGFTWRAIGASDRLSKCYLPVPAFATYLEAHEHRPSIEVYLHNIFFILVCLHCSWSTDSTLRILFSAWGDWYEVRLCG